MSKISRKSIGKELKKVKEESVLQVSGGRVIKFIYYAIYFAFLFFCLSIILKMMNSKCDTSGYCTSPGDIHMDWFKYDGSIKRFCWKNLTRESYEDNQPLLYLWNDREKEWDEFDLSNPDKSNYRSGDSRKRMRGWGPGSTGSDGETPKEFHLIIKFRLKFSNAFICYFILCQGYRLKLVSNNSKHEINICFKIIIYMYLI